MKGIFILVGSAQSRSVNIGQIAAERVVGNDDQVNRGERHVTSLSSWIEARLPWHRGEPSRGAAYHRRVADYYLVETGRGPGWDDGKRRREQPGWDRHASFMDGLVEARLVVLGGPIGDVDGDQALLVVDARSEEEARKRLAGDPWADGVLTLRSIRPWTLWLRAEAQIP
jgi:hypothetical protein